MEPDGPSANPRRAAMENYGARPDVHDLLSRFMTDLLCTQPNSKFQLLPNPKSICHQHGFHIYSNTSNIESMRIKLGMQI